MSDALWDKITYAAVGVVTIAALPLVLAVAGGIGLCVGIESAIEHMRSEHTHR